MAPSRDFAHVEGHNHHASMEGPNHYTMPKKLIVCCDGTWMDSDNGWVPGSWGKRGHLQNPSNVTRIARAISAEDDSHHPQIVYYQAGVGTGIGLYDQLLGGGTGLGLEENIREAYAFLASNYRENDPERPGVDADTIFLLGFSRGAFTARSIAGLLGAIGLLKKRAMPHFYEAFSDWENAGNPDYTPLFFDGYFQHHQDVKHTKPSNELARDNTKIDQYLDEYLRTLLSLDLTQEVQIKCIGVWDTVGALGIPVNPVFRRVFPFLPNFIRQYSWFDTRLDKHIENAFQALALDERRYPFSPTLWELRNGCPTKLKQVWFPGAHSNVGGSYADAGMANITLAWMMDQLAGHTTAHPNGFVDHDWIKFDDHYVRYWEHCEHDWYEKHKKSAYRGWAMGYLYDTLYLPMSLTGKAVRKPGRYHRTSYETGKPDLNHRLENTHEYVHSSVRARLDLGGRGVEADWTKVFPNSFNIGPLLAWLWRHWTGQKPATYKPQRRGAPLHGWKLRDGHESHFNPNMDIDMSPDRPKPITWVYEGNEPCGTTVMLEDKLGPYELKLLEKDQEFSNQIRMSNNSWRWFKNRLPGQHAKHGHTF